MKRNETTTAIANPDAAKTTTGKPSKRRGRGSPGRPAGSPSTTDIAQGELTRCPKCGSTDRGRYTSRTEQAFNGADPKGQPFTHLVWRRCRCYACGQHRIDKLYENRAAKA